MNPTRLLLGSALTLSVLALVSFSSRPRPSVAPAGLVVTSQGGPVKVEVRPSHTALLAQGTELFAEVTVTLEADASSDEQPISLALVLDTSGSMSGQKMADAKKAAHRLVDLLTERDELALVTFGTGLSVAERRRIDAGSRASFHAAIDAASAAGSTNLSGGLEAGWEALRSATGARRLVLVSDGQPTVGLTTLAQFSALVGRVHDDAITVTALGVGADIDGALMQLVAERGGGMYGYLKDAGALEELLGREVDAARRAIARNVVLQLDAHDFHSLEVPGRSLEYRDGAQLLYLADLRPQTPTRVLMRLVSRPDAPGVLARLGVGLRWQPLVGSPLSTGASLELPLVEDPAQVAASRDEGVYARGIGALGSLRLVAAAAAYERGDDAAARSLLDNARSLFSLSADALAGEAEVEHVRSSFSAASPAGRKDLARGLERKTLANFGKENEGY